jgi:hypothetical protein
MGIREATRSHVIESIPITLRVLRNNLGPWNFFKVLRTNFQDNNSFYNIYRRLSNRFKRIIIRQVADYNGTAPVIGEEAMDGVSFGARHCFLSRGGFTKHHSIVIYNAQNGFFDGPEISFLNRFSSLQEKFSPS